MRYTYPAVFEPGEPGEPGEGGYVVYFPDIKQGGTQGETWEECIDMAEDFLAGALYDIEESMEDV